MNLTEKFTTFSSFLKISTASDVDSHSGIEEISKEEPLSKNLKNIKVMCQVQLVVGRIPEDWDHRAFFLKTACRTDSNTMKQN